MQWRDYTNGSAERHPVAGTLKVGRLHSPQLDNDRDVFVYLPTGYSEDGRRYPVIYMHDGQNLFDDAISFAGAWKADQAVEHASRIGVEAIVVGISNAEAARLDEYSPWADERGGGKGDLYLDFVVDTLKPIVDRDFATNPVREATGIAGSSMGGLISLYGFFRNRETFGYAGAMSPAFWFAGGAIFDYVETAEHVPGRLYLDVGTAEGDAVLNDVRRMCEMLNRKGYERRRDLLCIVERGARHRERAWARRLPRNIRFFLRSLVHHPAHGEGT